ncbi:MAG: carbon-nitrogen hydrolase family protein [Longimicrobiales bacterium]|nr:carbon-nitrogen hydrolase family protein [Longimicrobiales bacterium]
MTGARKVLAAVVQAEQASSLEAAVAATRAGAESAARDGAELVVFPETWIPGYPAWMDYSRDVGLWDHPPVKAAYARLVESSVAVGDASYEALADLARDLEITLVVGVSERVMSGPGRATLYNSLFVFGPDGALLNHHRKLTPTHTERLLWGPGDTAGLKAVDTPAGRLGGLICWEHWNPLARQALHDSGEDVHVATWSAVVGVNGMHQEASRCYAFEARCHVLAAGQLMRASALPAELDPSPDKVEGPDQWLLSGGSAIIAPDGSYLAGPLYGEAGTLMAELDYRRNVEEAMTLDVSGHYQRPELFEFRVRGSERPRRPEDDR